MLRRHEILRFCASGGYKKRGYIIVVARGDSVIWDASAAIGTVFVGAQW